MNDMNSQTQPTKEQSPIVDLAWKTLEALVHEWPLPRDCDLPDSFPPRAGCFVTLHVREGHELRGCIGTIEPTRATLCEEVMRNTISAATGDPRFPAVEAFELDGLEISVDVLHSPEPASRSELDPSQYGVIVTQGYRRGLLLPDLEGVDTVEQQLAIAASKAGIDPESEYDIERFKVDRYE